MFFPQDKSEINEVKPTGKLMIENLHWDVSEQDLKNLFEQIGPVTKAYIRVSPTKHQPNFQATNLNSLLVPPLSVTRTGSTTVAIDPQERQS